MLPTTRVSFANLNIFPSDALLVALTGAYLMAAGLLITLVVVDVLPLPWVWLMFLWLWPEYVKVGNQTAQLKGRLVLFSDQQLAWQNRKWRLSHVLLFTPYLLVMELEDAQQVRRLVICRDACTDSDFRRLSLFCRLA
ncbi:protein YgfX [Photobacterium galatheae]|uniref:protein YgfX n=1 Tax=Photobacterium galatheae TaxID=1654360 RepID=UPI00137752CA|nr:protein YgfX [Photobacterium galatheae]